MKQLILIFSLIAVFETQAQVKLQLSLMSDKKTYMVSMISEKSLTFPENITGTVQITLRYPSGKQFLVSNFKNLITGVQWHDNSYLEAPQSAKKYSFVSFGLRSPGTQSIPYEAGKEVPLFSFENHYSCVGKLELVDNATRYLDEVETRTYNLGNHWTTVADQTEAYAGNLQSVIECDAPTAASLEPTDLYFSAMTAYPVPTSESLNLSFTANAKYADKFNAVRITNSMGMEMMTQKVKIQSGDQNISLDVGTLTPGLYLFQLQGEKISGNTHKFVVVK